MALRVSTGGDEVDLGERSPLEHAHDGEDEAENSDARAKDAEVAPPSSKVSSKSVWVGDPTSRDCVACET